MRKAKIWIFPGASPGAALTGHLAPKAHTAIWLTFLAVPSHPVAGDGDTAEAQTDFPATSVFRSGPARRPPEAEGGGGLLADTSISQLRFGV